jgi:hypothetical protein
MTTTTPALQTPCAEGNHYACGYKNCSCSCHLRKKPKPKAGAATGFVILALLGYGIYHVFSASSGPHATGSLSSATSSSKLNPQALSFAVLSLSDELQHALSGSGGSALPKDQAISLAEIDLSVTAQKFEADYDANEIAADAKYKGRRFLLSGVIESINKDFTDEGFLTLRSGSLTGVQAALNQRGMQNAGSLQRGEKIDLVCHSSSRVIGSAIAGDCERLNQYLEDFRGPLNEQIEKFLDGDVALPRTAGVSAVMLYEIGLHLSPNSPCFAAIDKPCEAEVAGLTKDKGMAGLIREAIRQMLAKVKLK